MKNKLLLFSIFIFLGTFISYASCPGDTAHFTTNAPNGKCIIDSVKFTDASTIESGDAIASWSWNFGNPGSGGNNTSSLQNPSHLYSASGSFFVRLIVTYTLGCKDTVTIGVGIQNTVFVNAGLDIASCKNNIIVNNLVGTVYSAGGAQWYNTPFAISSGTNGTFSPSNNINSSPAPVYTPTAAAKANGTDTLILTSYSPANCPNVSDTVVIFFQTGPTANVGSNISVCKDTSSIPVSATILNATGGIWKTTGGGHFADSTHLSTFYSPSSSDTAAGFVIIYMKTTGNGICLPSNDSLKITFTPTPVVVIKTNDSICSRSPIILVAISTTGSGFWSSSGTGTFAPNNTGLNGFYHPSAAEDLAGKVTLKFTSTNNAGCHSSFDTLVVTIKPTPTAAYTSIVKCAKVPMQFTDATSPSGSIASWTWSFGDFTANSTSQNPVHTYTTGGPYNVSLIVKSNNGCKDTSTQQVNVFRIPTVDYTAAGICMNEGTTFTSAATVTGATIAAYNWLFGDLTTSNLADPLHFFTTSGPDTVKLIVQSSQGCFDSITHTVPVVAGPVSSFTVSAAAVNIDQQITFTDQSTSAISLSWNFGDSLGASTQQNPTHTYTVGGLYPVCLTATDASGCKDVSCQQETVITHAAGPSAFSPNGDGKNDVFYIYGGPFKTLDFRIYNNWGELIFESYKQSDGWDGKRNGIDQPIGVYVYTVIGITAAGNEYKLSGDLTLLR